MQYRQSASGMGYRYGPRTHPVPACHDVHHAVVIYAAVLQRTHPVPVCHGWGGTASCFPPSPLLDLPHYGKDFSKSTPHKAWTPTHHP
jgi:hypothetical protein